MTTPKSSIRNSASKRSPTIRDTSTCPSERSSSCSAARPELACPCPKHCLFLLHKNGSVREPVGVGAIAIYRDERRPPSPALPMLTSGAARRDEPEASTVRTGESGPHRYQ